jgi:capsular exopolysaccharide synthesis family protein
MSNRKKFVINAETPFSISEAYKAARTNLMFSLSTGESKAVVVTSGGPSEGKSTTCVNIAITFAKTGASVIVIDADLRKPQIHDLLEVSNPNGLSAILGGFCNVQDAINSAAHENLDVIVAGTIPPNPAELLGSESMMKLLFVLKDHYDYIFIDTPPVNVVSDALLMNSMISGVIFVVREEQTTHPELRNAIYNIRLSGNRLLGFIKNGCNPKNSGKYKYRYRYSYETDGG